MIKDNAGIVVLIAILDESNATCYKLLYGQTQGIDLRGSSGVQNGVQPRKVDHSGFTRRPGSRYSDRTDLHSRLSVFGQEMFDKCGVKVASPAARITHSAPM